MRRLIVNADDFGLTSGVNRAIIEGNRSGIVTSATLMANAKATDAAIDLAKAQSSLKTGCHVVLIDGVPLTGNLPTLTETPQRFRSSLKQFALAAVRKQISAEEVQREAGSADSQDPVAGNCVDASLTATSTRTCFRIFYDRYCARPKLAAFAQ